MMSYLGYTGLLILELICQGVNLWSDAVYIEGPQERIEKVGSNFSLKCHANDTISWKYPASDSTKFSETTEKNPWGYTTELIVDSSDYLATGFYNCSGEKEEASVYVYIFDEDHLLAVDPQEIFLFGLQYRDIVIPCKPTSPHVQVTLTNDDEPVKFAKYDPRIGFSLSNLTFRDSGLFSCIGTKDGHEEEEQFSLTIDPDRKIAPKPEISETSLQRVVVGQDVTLNCFVRAEKADLFDVMWILPKEVDLTGRYNISNCTIYGNLDDNTHEVQWRKSLSLSQVVKSDEGNYTCKVVDHSGNVDADTRYLKIYSKDDSFINISVQSKKIEVDVTLGEIARWVFTINAHPNVELTWYGPDENEIPRSMALSDKYQMREEKSQTILEIFDVELQDAGNYTLVATNSGGKKILVLELIVYDKPSVFFNFSGYYRINVPANVSCLVEGYPTPNIHWKFRRCTFYTTESNCSEYQSISAEYEKITEFEISETHIISTILWSMQEPGELSCTAINEKGNDTNTLLVLVTDVPQGFWIKDTPEEIVEGDNLTLACAVVSYEFWSSPWWVFESEDSEPVVVDKNFVTVKNRNYSYWSEMQIKNVNISNSGNYSCKAHKRDNFTLREKTVSMKILRAEPPEIFDTNLPNNEMSISSWQPLTWHCKAKGVPVPSVTWYKDDDVLIIDNDFSNFELLDKNRTLAIKSLTMDEEGRYTCKAKNKKGEVEAFVYLKLKESHKTNTTLIISVVVVVILLIIVLFLFFYALWKMAKEKKELKLAGLQNFKEGMTKAINQDLTLDQQTDLLPYDPKWEFPGNKLKLGKQLGAGAFGVVLKAEAYGIMEEGEWTTVAVKMVKRQADPAYIRALVSELKILAHLGKHLNVVNLLGACTKNYTKRELLIIVEFCKYGNAHNYLLSHRHRFIDQIDHATGEIDITKRNTVENYNRIRINYATLTFPRSVDSDPNSAWTSLNTEMTCLSSERSGRDSLTSNNNPEWCANLQGDYKIFDLDELSTSTLLCWSFQVARGMEYLASRRVLHGDLAARNVLIADNNIVKICDFGFAKNIYSHPEYQKTGDGPVPVKWMAIESITRRIFSTQSDVWSFGIVLWEFFSLAKTPYPGFENFESILNKLESGYRMEKPQYANQTLYDIMLECWDTQPCRRPSFSELVMKLGKLLQNNVREHYIELNEPFNKQIEGEDYLSMMSPPNYDPPMSNYVNEQVLEKQSENENSDGYLCMRSSWNPVTPKESNPEDIIEMKPMLSDKDMSPDSFNDDYLIPRQKPQAPDCVFNPSYIMSSNVSNKPQSHYGKINKV